MRVAFGRWRGLHDCQRVARDVAQTLRIEDRIDDPATVEILCCLHACREVLAAKCCRTTACVSHRGTEGLGAGGSPRKPGIAAAHLRRPW